MNEPIALAMIGLSSLFSVYLLYKEFMNKEKGNILRGVLLSLPFILMAYLCYNIMNIEDTLKKIDLKQFKEYKKALDYSSAQKNKYKYCTQEMNVIHKDTYKKDSALSALNKLINLSYECKTGDKVINKWNEQERKQYQKILKDTEIKVKEIEKEELGIIYYIQKIFT